MLIRTKNRLPLQIGLVMSLVGILGPLHAKGQETAAQPPADTTTSQSPHSDHTVLLTNIQFTPDRLKIAAGQTVKFINHDKFKHDVYLVRAANRNQVLIPTTVIGPGQSITVRIDEAGLFTLYCTIHGGMSGKITTTGTFELTQEEKDKAALIKTIPPIVKTGEALFWGSAQCYRCHQIGEQGDGLRGPNLADIGFRAAFRAKELGLGSATAYIQQSLMEPSAYIVEGFSDDMPKVYHQPISLDGRQLKAIITYLQNQGGEVDTWAIDINGQKLDTQPAMNPFRDGDPSHGHGVFKKMQCGSCHTVGDQDAISVGPDLTEIGAYRNWTWLAQSVIDPNAEIGANWQNVTVYLQPAAGDKNDQEYDEYGEDEGEEKVTGILRKNNEVTEAKVRLLVGHNRFRTFERGQVDRVEVDKHSRMPTNYGQLMTFQQMADLVRYLESLGRQTGQSPEQ